jgi:hypothetical protein
MASYYGIPSKSSFNMPVFCGYITARNDACRFPANRCPYHNVTVFSEWAKFKQKHPEHFKNQEFCGAPLVGHGRRMRDQETCKNIADESTGTCRWHLSSSQTPEKQRMAIYRCYGFFHDEITPQQRKAIRLRRKRQQQQQQQQSKKLSRKPPNPRRSLAPSFSSVQFTGRLSAP